jgi:hypothetical protein
VLYTAPSQRLAHVVCLAIHHVEAARPVAVVVHEAGNQAVRRRMRLELRKRGQNACRLIELAEDPSAVETSENVHSFT